MADTTDLEPELDAAERAALATWDAPSPPAGFADRLADAPRAVSPAPATASRRRLGLIAATISAAALAAAAAIMLAISGAPPPIVPATGAVTVAERRSIPIGGRAVAVAEPGAVMAWAVDDRGVRVEHGAGNVFYRVDHGGPFVVATSLGEVRVTGTCFRIEVIMKPSKSQLVSGAVGAALAAALVVTVYEGGVVVANPHGSTRVGPGERATITGDSAPSVEGAAVAELSPPEASVTREQLLARDELQRQRIAGLTSRVTDLERELASGGGGGGGGRGGDGDDGHPFFDPGADQLAAFAKQCKVQFDLPPIMGSSTFQIDADKVGEYGITDAERGPLNEVLAELHESWAERIRAIYLDVVGETGADQGLSAQAMIQEIEDKSPGPERSAIQARIANERAGLVQPPADWSHAAPIERLMRSLAALGDETEKLIAARIGADRAHALRAKDGGWPSKWSMSGCHDGPE